MANKNANVLEILVKGRPITEYVHNELAYVEGRKNSDYVIRYRNNTAIRKKIVVSVDGLNVISGDINWQSGYVVEPWGLIDIPGWRKDDKNVAKFKFSSVGQSYNQHNENGDIANIGVIGVKVFHEQSVYSVNLPEIKHVYHHHVNDWSYPYYTTFTGGGWSGSVGTGFNNVNVTPTGGAGGGVCTASSGGRGSSSGGTVSDASVNLAATPQQDIGTGWGKNAEFKTAEANYVFYATESDTLLIYYDTREGLERRGVNVRNRVRPTPDAFPTYTGVRCPPPR